MSDEAPARFAARTLELAIAGVVVVIAALLVLWVITTSPKVDWSWSGWPTIVALATLAGILATALGTLFLAVSTRDMAKATSASVDLQRREIRATERSLEAAVQPMLVDLPIIRQARVELETINFEDGQKFVRARQDQVVVPMDTGDAVHVSVPLRNIGPGPALITGLSIFVMREASCRGQMTNAVVAQSELTRLNFTVLKGRGEYRDIISALARGGPVEVEVGYTDGAGEQRFRTRVNLYSRNGRWYVRQVFLYRGSDENYFAASGPRDA